VQGTICKVKIRNMCCEYLGTSDISFIGTDTTVCNNSTMFTANANGVVKNDHGEIVATIFGVVNGTYETSCQTPVCSGILTGYFVYFKNECCVAKFRNPYIDSQPGTLAIFKLLDKINLERMIEILGDGIGGLGKRLLNNKEQCVSGSQFRDHSKKYRGKNKA